MELKFECPTCGQHISATPAQIGVTAPCPNCKTAVTVPNPSTLSPSLPPSPQPQSPPAANTATARKRRKSEFLGKGASRPMLIIGIIALVALLIFAASQHSSSPGKPPVKAQAALTRSAVVIKNLDDFTWPAVTLYLNGTPLDGYKAIYDQSVAPRQEISVPLTEFARGDRRRPVVR
jgi:hypothetical protein